MTAPAVRTLALVALATGLVAAATLTTGQDPGSGAYAAPAAVDLDAVRTLGDPVAGLADLDVRDAVAPLSGQRQAAATLDGVHVRWNDLGTPASVLPDDGSLGAAPGTPAEGARAWLRDHADLFGVSPAAVDDLEVVNAQALQDSPARAVLFRQKFGSLVPATGGMVTVGVTDGKVAYVSSSLSRATGTPPAATLSPKEGWLEAAADVGRAVTDSELGGIDSNVSGGWTRLTVPGLVQEQLVRLRALPLSDGDVRPVYEANVVDVSGGSTLAHTVLVDAINGDVLVRRNQVDNAVYNNVFTGKITPTTCGTRHPFDLGDGATKQINTVATAAPADDITVNIYGPGGLLLSQDLLTSPEVATYSADSIPAGTYSVEICPFDATSVVVGQYSVAVSTSDTAAPGGSDVGFSPRWRYFEANPTLDSATEIPSNSVIGCWRPAADCTATAGAHENIAAFGPWDSLTGGVPTNTTVGNNANTHEAWGSPLTPGGTFQAPTSATREYTTEFTDSWNNSKCDPTQLTPGGNDIEASVGNLFVAHNRMHDFAYYLGFTEENYNLQQDNGGRGGVAGDSEVGNAQAGAISGGSPSYLGRDNANQIALQDGVPGITNQYLFQPIAGAFYAPCTDGGLDMGIVGHEYTHAISNRMVGGPDDGLTSEQGGAMGESWSDLVAGEYQFSHDHSNGGNPWAVGVYATGNKDVAIRDYSIDKNPLNYSDYGFDVTGDEVHANGEIWNGTLWDVRQALVEKYDAQFPYADKALQLQCAQATKTQTPRPADACPGNRRWVQLLFDSFLLQQGDTSMLDARDAMLAADSMRFGGADLPQMWSAFARRGMGRDASTPDASSGDTTPSFASPMADNTTVTFQSSGAARIYVGDYEARATPVADTVGTTGLGAAAPFAPGTYRMLAVSPDHGFQRFTLEVAPGGGARTVVVPDTDVNVASAAAGATVIGSTAGSLNPEQLIDGTEETNWGGVTAANVDETTPSVAVDLAGDVQTVRRVQVSAMLTPAPADPNEVPLAADPDSGSRFTALRQFAVEACVADCASAGAAWTRFYTSPADAFPSRAPRPVAPDLTMRVYDVPATQASAVRLVALQNQCTGNPAYAGELDNDPNNATDCKTKSDRGTIVHASELQVFTTPAPVTGPGSGTDPGSGAGTPPTGTPVPGTTPTTPTPTTGSGAARTAIALTVFRRVQTRFNAPPKLKLGVEAGGSRLRTGGSIVIRLDGKKFAEFNLNKLEMVTTVRRPLAVGSHTVRVTFQPFDTASYTKSRSPKVRIQVLRD
ncbi:M36 family metallopeptidase [Nocardioides sp. InS609-2]|uniref:M36 family metallopeptidase n=1 Tax=Nocardioides sp. InS609-2 TaxID=2760705 RepID=UPI002097F6C8|nr:M36 family metallopeptidase [Nocardioides sp. InS609-2]